MPYQISTGFHGVSTDREPVLSSLSRPHDGTRPETLYTGERRPRPRPMSRPVGWGKGQPVQVPVDPVHGTAADTVQQRPLQSEKGVEAVGAKLAAPVPPQLGEGPLHRPGGGVG